MAAATPRGGPCVVVPSQRRRLRRIDPDDPERAEDLGAVEFDARLGLTSPPGSAIVVDDLLIVIDSTLTAYQVTVDLVRHGSGS